MNGKSQGSKTRLRLTPAERRWMLLLLDVLTLNAALLATLALRYEYTFGVSTVAHVPLYFALLTVVWLVWASFFDCYDLPRSGHTSLGAWSAGRAALAAAVTYLAIPYYSPYFTESRLSALLFCSLTTMSVAAWRLVYARVFSQKAFQQRLLIVGAGRSGSELAHEVVGKSLLGTSPASAGLLLVGFVDDDPTKAGAEIEGIPVLGGRRDLSRLVEEHRIDTLVLAITHAPTIQPELFQALLDCREQGIRLELMTSLYERLTGRVPVDHAGRNLHVVLSLSDSPLQRLVLAGKRLADLMFAGLGLILVACLVPWVAVANAFTGPGPLFYWQARVGRGGRPFRLVKFRSMVPDAEQHNGAVWAAERDPRVTPVGRLLRRTRLDEVPQVWNILKGDMSLVGPRPERPEFVAELARDIPFYQVRHAVRPGITGWAQVRYGYGSSKQDALVKLQYDLYYIKHQGVYLELSILVKTVAVMLGLRGR